MKIAVAADSHDNYFHVQWFLAETKRQAISKCFFLGDIINPSLAKEYANSQMQFHIIFGNNDGDKVNLTKAFLKNENQVAAFCFDNTTVEEKNVFLTHYPLLGEIAAKSNMYDAIFYAHNHRKFESKQDGILLVNPGELSGHATGVVSFYVWDTETNTGEFVIHPGPKPAKPM